MILWFLKLLAILPSGSTGKFLKKIWNLEKLGGEEAIFASVLRRKKPTVLNEKRT